MVGVLSFYRTTIGKKVIMAITGGIWVLYVMLHMFGNLKFFQGAEAIDGWAHFLRTFGQEVVGYEGVLWLVRIVLVVSLVLHVWMAWQLSRLSWASRPVKYSRRRWLAADFSGRTMRWGGVFIAVFLVIHIGQLTTGALLNGFQEGEVYRNLILLFSNNLIAAFYILMMIVLALHLNHGIWSLFHSLGWNTYPSKSLKHRLCQLVAIAVPLGFALVPISIVLMGVMNV
ncbi:MAG: succinate dehydrogenase cytochrome b subunit [Anaerolineae bacterium]|nr:succinate dehydrogenase cytochrome b subunit [Anaerolineae bacterium]